MSGPLDGVLVVDLTRALAGPHAGDDARRPRRAGDQGGDPRQRRRHPRLGPAVRRSPDQGERESTYFLSDQQEQGVDHPRPQGRRRQGGAHRAAAPRRRADGELPPRHAGPARLRHRRAGRAQPAAGDPGDQRFRARRPGGRPRRLRPDRPGRGRADVADRVRAGRPAAGRRPDRRPAGRHVRRLRRARRAARARADRPRPGRAHLAAGRRSSACTPSRGRRGPWRARSAAAQGNHHPSIAPYGLFHCAGGERAAGLRQRGAVAQALRRVRLRPRGARHGDQRRAGGATATRSSSCSRAPSPTSTPTSCWPGSSKVGIPAGKVRTLDEVYGWDQAISQGLQVDVEHATLGRLSLPGPPLRFFDAGPGRRDRDHPPRPHRSPGPRCRRRRDPRVVVRRAPTVSRSPPVTTSRTDTRRERPATGPGGRPDPARPGAGRGLLEVLGLPRAARRGRRPTTPPSSRRGRGEDPPGRVDHHRRGASCAAAASPSSPASSASSPARSASPPPSG